MIHSYKLYKKVLINAALTLTVFLFSTIVLANQKSVCNNLCIQNKAPLPKLKKQDLSHKKQDSSHKLFSKKGKIYLDVSGGFAMQ
jgi:hypothetical protein